MSKKNYFSILALDALFEGGRLFVGATSAAYLLSQGVSLSQLAILKSVQAVVLILAEVPTGLFADSFGRKKSLLFSLAVALIGFILYFSSKTFSIYLIAEALVAISLCFWSGAYEAYAIESAKLESEAGLMDRFFHANQAINSAAILFFGYLGGVIAKGGLALPYVGAALVFVFTFAFLLPMPALHDQPEGRLSRPPMLKSLIEKTRFAFANGLLSKRLAPFFWANIAIQFAIQPLLQFWQPLFQNMSASVTSETLGRIFTFYCAGNLIFGAVAAKYSKKELFQSPLFTAALFLIFGCLYSIVGLSSNLTVAIASFTLCQGALSVARTALGVRFNEALSGLPRATILSSLSLVSRLGMIGALGFLAEIARVSKAQNQQTMFASFGLFTVITSLLALVMLLIAIRKRAVANRTMSSASAEPAS